jgi:hypothetical protein
MQPDTGAESRHQECSLGQLLAYFLRLGTLGFGGPIALAGAMQRDLVDQRRWITLQEYKEGLALAQLAPGPLAAQLAIYLGWVRFKVLVLLGHKLTRDLSPYPERRGYVITRRNSVGGRHLLSDLDSSRT